MTDEIRGRQILTGEGVLFVQKGDVALWHSHKIKRPEIAGTADIRCKRLMRFQFRSAWNLQGIADSNL